MARCELSIQLDREDARFRPGEVIAGHVEARVDAACRCDALTVTFGWRTSGKGKAEAHEEPPARIFTGEWSEGEVTRHPFSFTAPPGPLTYRGHILSIAWFLRAHADIPWAIDPKAEVEVILEPWTEEALLLQRAGGYRSPPARFNKGQSLALAEAQKASLDKGKRSRGGIAAVVGVLLLAVALFLVTSASREEVQTIGLVPMLAGIGALLYSLVSFVRFLEQRHRDNKRLDRPVITVGKDRVHPGDRLPIRIGMPPERAAVLEEVSVRVIGAETAEDVATESYFTHGLHTADFPVDARTLARLGGQASAIETEVLLPADAAPSFEGQWNKVLWQIIVNMRAEDGETWFASHVLAVEPPRPEARAEAPRRIQVEASGEASQEALDEAHALEEAQAIEEARAREDARRRS
jgi:hypothetical protein